LDNWPCVEKEAREIASQGIFETPGPGASQHYPAVEADAHMKRQIMRREFVVAITEGTLDFGSWRGFLMASSTAVAASGC
jgi:D-alanine-D-alanine ligase-like ATP-grasp enzyme